MRLRHADGQTIHLSYCTNVHPAEDLDGIIDQLDTYAVKVRRILGSDVLGLGLWLAKPVASALAAEPALRLRLRRELDARAMEVVTLNGFPYQSFQAPVVKHAVYQPDWTTQSRLDYTLDLARILVDLLPDDAVRGSISTLPLAWRTPWDPARADIAGRMLDDLATGLGKISADTGRTIRIGFEPEPGCIVETTSQAVNLLAKVDTEWLGICLDLAHLACAWEEPAEALTRLARAGLPVVKVQVSAALTAEDPAAASTVLHGYAEPRFLHQTRGASGFATDDLSEALDRLPPSPGSGAAQAEPWRVHYHVPLHAAPEPPLASTLPVLRAALRELFRGEIAGCDHLDVETYTWGVLPAALRPHSADQLAAGIAAELAFTRDELFNVGLGLPDLTAKEATS